MDDALAVASTSENRGRADTLCLPIQGRFVPEADIYSALRAPGPWGHLNGNTRRGTGLLQNELYAGRLVWNKVRMVKDPDTGKRISRPNPKSERQIADVTGLAIIPRKLFEAAQKRKEARSVTHPNQQRRPRHILSGLLRCGTCGAGMSTNGKDKSGRIRIRCSAATESGTCSDPKTFCLDTVEKAVLNGLTGEMRHPDVIAEFVRTYREERKRLAADADAKRNQLQRRLDELTGEIDRLVDAIAKGHGDPTVLGPRATAAHKDRKRVMAELEAALPPTEVITLHPAVLTRYEQQLTHLQESLARGVEAGDSEAAEAIRNLVETVTVFRDPSKPGCVEVEIAGRLTALRSGSVFRDRT